MTRKPPFKDAKTAPAPFKGAKTAWILSDGTRGMEIQSLGLADALGLEYEVIRLPVPTWLSRLPYLALLPMMPLPAAIAEAVKRSDWPDVTISTGRRMAGYSMLVQRRGRRRSKTTRTIHIQDPKIPPRHFDLLVVPSHDRLRGENVIVTTGSLGAPTAATIKMAAQNLPDAITSLPAPVMVFLIGGSNRRYSVGHDDYYELGRFAARLATRRNASLAFITSRRSAATELDGLRAAMRKLGGGIPQYITDTSEINPYPGILARADAIIVTSDSVNMVSEACSTGKPVFVYDFREETGRIGRFHKIIREGDYARPARNALTLPESDFAKKPEAVLDETVRVARLIRDQ